MRLTPVVAAAAGAAAVLAVLPAAPASAGGRPFTTTLTGAAEVPGPGDPDGSGQARLTINPGTGQVCYRITTTGVAPLAAGHIHEADAGAAGGVVVGLFSGQSANTLSGCVTTTRAQALEILRDPSGYYVNVHNADFQGGAVRGQLSR